MTKLSKKQMDPEKFGHYMNNLWSAFTLMDTKDDVRLLFKDLFTHTEYKMFAKRLEIARCLFEGKIYQDIQKELGVTANTITRINNTLSIKGDGFKKAHEKLTQIEKRYLDKQREKTKNLENPFRAKVQMHRRTALGGIIKAGIKELDKKISKSIKQKTAKKYLKI